MWRYRALLPLPTSAVTEQSIPQLIVGNTPFFACSEIRDDLGVKEFWIKDDGRNPTASLKGILWSRPVAVPVRRVRARFLAECPLPFSSTSLVLFFTSYLLTAHTAHFAA